MAFRPYREWARRLGASPPKRICCFMVRVPRGSNRIQGCGASFAPNWRALLGSSPSVSTLSARPHWSDLTGESPYKRLPRASRWSGNGTIATRDPTPWHELQTWLESGERRVVIPYAAEITAAIPPAAVRLRRDVDTLWALVASHALLHQAQRERDPKGQIIATLDDYAAVHELVADL